MTQSARQIIAAADWASARFGWLESVRRDASLSTTARLVAHVLALDFANHRTMQCNPSRDEIAGVVGVSTDTVKRAVAELIAGGWVAIETGRGRGRCSGYTFLTRARIVPLKGRTPAPFYDVEKGASVQPFPRSQKGANLPGKGGKNALRHNIAKNHSSNHNAQTSAEAQKPRRSQNPVIIAEATRAVAAFREGRRDAFEALPSFTRNHIIAADLLTPQERETAGLV